MRAVRNILGSLPARLGWAGRLSGNGETTLFVAVATGQNVANLPPILEMGRRGDAVLWVLSPGAASGSGTTGANHVLERRGLRILPPASVEDINVPSAVASGVLGPLTEAVQRAGRLVVVLNGGQKLTPIGLAAVAQAAGGTESRLLYGQSQPAELWVIQPDTWEVERRPYSQSLTVPEILACSGYAIANRGEARPVWYRRQGVLSRPAASYPPEDEAANALHREYHLRGRATRFELFAPGYEELASFFGEQALTSWKATVDRFLAAGEEVLCRRLYEATVQLLGCGAFVPGWGRLDASEKERLRTGLHAVRQHVRRLRRAEPSADLSPPLKEVYLVVRSRLRIAAEQCMARRHPTLPPLGPAFEAAVEGRLVEWLGGGGRGTQVVSEVWANVKVGRKGVALVDAEFDLLLALVNGILVHLECKSFTADQKDLDARLTTLQASGSRLAEMVVVGPVYSRHAEEDWLRHVENLRQRIESLGRSRFIPFTMRGQPGFYRRQAADGSEETVQVPSFEESLTELLGKYCRNAEGNAP